MDIERDPWTENLFLPLVIAAMVGCVAWSLTRLVLIFAPTWNPTYLIVGCVLAALDGYLSFRLLLSSRMRGTSVLRFRIIELALILILLKAGRYVGRSFADVLAEIEAWPRDLSLVFDLETLTAFALALLCWDAATETARDLKNVSEPPKKRALSGSPVRRLIGRYFAGGAVLLIAFGLSRLGSVSVLLDLRRPTEGGLVLNALVYFFLGLLMLGQTRYVELRRRWRSEEMLVAEDVATRWVRYSLSFVGLATLLALVLPTGFTEGLLNALADSLGLVSAVLFYLVSFILTLVMLPLAWLIWLLSSLFSHDAEERARPAPQLPAFDPPQRPAGAQGMNWLQIMWPVIFWLIVAGVVFYVIRTYLRDRPGLRKALTGFEPLPLLCRGCAAFWRWLKGWTIRLGKAVGESLPRQLMRPFRSQESEKMPFRFFRLRALSPREKVLYYYLSILRRAGRQGYARRGHQTPYEYATMMESNLPQAREELDKLTQAFVEARFGRHEITADQDQRARSNWERVKAALRVLQRRRTSGEVNGNRGGMRNDN